MSRAKAVLLVVLAAVLLVAGAGCADQSDEANRIIDEINDKVTESTELDGEIADLWDEVSKIDPEGASVADAAPLLDELERLITEVTALDESIAEQWDEVAKLDVISEMKTWAGMRKEIVGLAVEIDGFYSQVLSKYRVLYDPAQTGAFGDADWEQLYEDVDDIVAESDDVNSELAAKQGAADQYYEDNYLGDY